MNVCFYGEQNTENVKLRSFVVGGERKEQNINIKYETLFRSTVVSLQQLECFEFKRLCSSDGFRSSDRFQRFQVNSTAAILNPN